MFDVFFSPCGAGTSGKSFGEIKITLIRPNCIILFMNIFKCVLLRFSFYFNLSFNIFAALLSFIMYIYKTKLYNLDYLFECALLYI